MRDPYRVLLTTLAGLFALWLILGFWPFSLSSRLMLCLLVILSCGVVLWRAWRLSQCGCGTVNGITKESLPPERFQGTVILACGDSAALFEAKTRHRETRQEWYLQVNDAEQLPLLVHHLSLVRPRLVPQIFVMLATLPEHHHSLDDFTQCLRGWQRAVVRCRPWLGGLPPLGSVTWVSPPGACIQEAPVWFTTASYLTDMQVHQPGQGYLQFADWINENESSGNVSRLSQGLWLNCLLRWQRVAVDNLLTECQGELPALRFCVQGFCMVPVSGRNDNLWQQHITGITALPPERGDSTGLLPLPSLLLPSCSGVSQRMALWRHMGLLTGIFLALAMLASFTHNQRLIRSVGDHLALYHRLNSEHLTSKVQAQQRLRADGHLLDDWQRRGAPLHYCMGLYSGLRLLAPVEAAISDWSPPAPVIQKIVQEPRIVLLDSLSLFNSGKSALKPGSTKMLVNSLMGIKAKPGRLIVISGHTDNTGNPTLNQRLSRERAVSVRDWMRDTGDVPESCFAVQGYGENRPIASNDTPEGRELNRRVEISLVSQADACQLPDSKLASPDDATF